MMFGTDPHIERARAHLASGDHDRLLYACLELRYAIERIVYQKLRLRLDKITMDEISAWQPRRALERLVELVDEHLHRDLELRIAPAVETEATAHDKYITIGHAKGVSPREIGKHWQKISSFLHIRMPRKKDDHPKNLDHEKLRTYLEDVIIYVDAVVKTGSDFHFSPTVRFSCTKCNQSIVRNRKLLHEETVVECQNEQCNASYVTHNDGGNFTFEPYLVTFKCNKCGETTHIEANIILKLKTDESNILTCTKCNAKHLVRWTLEISPESDALK